MEEIDERRLVAALASAATLAVRFEGVAYRSCAPRYAKQPDLLTGAGSRQFGGRWNPPGIAMVYASMTPEIAMAEALAHHRYFHIPIEDAMPRVFVAIDVRLSLVADLRDPGVVRALGIAGSELAMVDWRRDMAAGRTPLTQVLGRAVHAAGWEGLVVRSAATDGHNLLALPDRLGTGSFLRVRTPDRLAKS